MARTKQPQPPTGFVASAVRLPTVNPNEAGTQQGWQSQAWTAYDNVGELRYLANWIGNVLSRAQLHAAKRVGNELVLQTSGPAREAMDALYGGPQGQAQMLQLLGVDLTVSGEGYILARDDAWDVLSTGNVTQDRQGNITINDGNSTRETVTGSDLLIRVWTPHPTDPTKADAPTRSNLKTLTQIVGYDDHITAQLTSRLAGAGVLFLPTELDFAPPEDADPEATQAGNFMQVLGEAMSIPISDRTNPAAWVPLVVQVPGEFLEAVKHMTFWSELDKSVIEMRQAAIKRFGIGMDAPPEVLLGNADSNHWSAWLSEESAIKAHLEPRLAVINSALTTAYLRPSLDGTGEDPDEFYVIADTSEIRTRPNRSTESFELRDRGLINAEAVRRETGFKSEDAMNDTEYAEWLLQRISLGAVTPELTAEALRILGANIDPNLNLSPGTQSQPDATRSDTAINDDGQSGGAPSEDPLMAACEVMVWRALERAGNKLKNNGVKLNGSPVHKLYLEAKAIDADHVLAGAWDCADDILGGYDVDVPSTVDTLDFYVRGLLSTHRPHSKVTMTSLVRSWDAPTRTE